MRPKTDSKTDPMLDGNVRRFIALLAQKSGHEPIERRDVQMSVYLVYAGGGEVSIHRDKEAEVTGALVRLPACSYRERSSTTYVGSGNVISCADPVGDAARKWRTLLEKGGALARRKAAVVERRRAIFSTLCNALPGLQVAIDSYVADDDAYGEPVDLERSGVITTHVLSIRTSVEGEELGRHSPPVDKDEVSFSISLHRTGMDPQQAAALLAKLWPAIEALGDAPTEAQLQARGRTRVKRAKR